MSLNSIPEREKDIKTCRIDNVLYSKPDTINDTNWDMLLESIDCPVQHNHKDINKTESIEISGDNLYFYNDYGGLKYVLPQKWMCCMNRNDKILFIKTFGKKIQ